jgi:hypothetical protein
LNVMMAIASLMSKRIDGIQQFLAGMIFHKDIFYTGQNDLNLARGNNKQSLQKFYSKSK